MNEVNVTSWQEYSEIVSEKLYKRYIFRGHTKRKHRLETSLQRSFSTLSIRDDWQEGRELEALKSFKSRAHLYLQHLPEKEKDLEWLSIMQHYGAPTRLLDWTYSPFIAAFFAFQELERGCAVYEIDVKNLEHANHNSVPDDWESRLVGEGSVTGEFVAPYIPDYQNKRLVQQQGLFLVPSHINHDVEEIVNSYDETESFMKKYTFKLSRNDLKNAIKRLKAMNIDNYRLFPGIDGLSKSMHLRLLEPKQKF